MDERIEKIKQFLNEYGKDETFITDGYAFHDELLEEIRFVFSEEKNKKTVKYDLIQGFLKDVKIGTVELLDEKIASPVEGIVIQPIYKEDNTIRYFLVVKMPKFHEKQSSA